MTNKTETTSEGPRIYVASLSDYNAGVLHGAWIDCTEDVDSIREAIASMMALSPTAKSEGYPSEEYAIHDHEGFGPVRVDEYSDIETLAAYAEAIQLADDADAFAAWVANDTSVLSIYAADMADAFHESFRGSWSSVADYAAEYIDSVGMLAEVDELVARYFDFDAFARDLVLGGDIWTADAGNGDVFIFSGF